MLITILGVILCAVLGAVIGSFLGVVLDRSFREEQFYKGRSYCEACKNQLSVIELIPIFSYIYLRGKCKYCYAKIPSHLFIFEVILSLSFGLIFFVFARSLFSPSLSVLISFIFALLLCALLTYIFISDLKYMAISTYCFIWLFVLYVFGVLANVYIIEMPIFHQLFFSNYLDHLYGAIAMLAFFWPTYYLSKEKLMGEGDVYLGFLFGLFLGFKLSLVMWFISFLTGAIIGLLLIAISKKSFKSALPFGPFLVIGFIAAIFWGQYLSDLLFYYL